MILPASIDFLWIVVYNKTVGEGLLLNFHTNPWPAFDLTLKPLTAVSFAVSRPRRIAPVSSTLPEIIERLNLSIL